MSVRLRAVTLIAAVVLCGASLRGQETPDLAIPRVGQLPMPTQMHGTAVVGERLYVFGGEVSAGWEQSVVSAPIGADGKLGSWRTEVPLPSRLAYLTNSIEVVGNRIYVVGGVTAAAANTRELETVRSQDILWATVGADGVLGAWKKSPPFPGPHLGFLATSSTDRQLLVTGGSTSDSVSRKVYAADFAPDGEPVNWRPVGELPSPLWHHGAAVQGGRLYVWGGLRSRRNASQVRKEPADMNSNVWSAELRPDGMLGAWRDETPMPSPTFHAAASGINDYLVSIGGRYGDKTPTNGIWYARLEGGRIGEWKLVRTDLDARVYHSLGLDKTRGRIFVAGGQKKTAAGVQPVQRLDAVQAFEIPQPENTRLNAVEVASARTGGAGAGGRGATEFPPLSEALRNASRQKKPVLAFFYSPQVPDCRRFWDRVVQTPSFQALGRDYILSAIDISGPDSSLGPQYNIYKVPALALIGPDGARMKSSITLQSMEDVTKLVGGGK